MAYLPIGSNLSVRSDDDRHAQRAQLCVGVFGGLSPHRDVGMLRSVMYDVHRVHASVHFTYVGTAGDEFARLVPQGAGYSVVLDADLEAGAAAIRKFDVALAPFREGASARRGSLLATLQLGIPTVTTRGRLSRGALEVAAADGALGMVQSGDARGMSRACLDLLTSPQLRRQMGAAGQDFYVRCHSWTAVGSRLEALLTVRDRPA